MKNNFKKLLEKLKTIKALGVIGIKTSFEDEGVIFEDVFTIKRMTSLSGLDTFVKIGGCEALTDINNCSNIGIDNIIAPMVETKFALSKFIKSVKNKSNTKFYFVCETKTALSNLTEMLDSDKDKVLSGIIVGRSDLTSSFSMEKQEVDSDFICREVEIALQKAKNKNLETTLGGNISKKSVEFIKKMYNKNLLDKIETRNVVISLKDSNINDLENIIKKALVFETEWMNYKASKYLDIGNLYTERINVLKKRIN